MLKLISLDPSGTLMTVMGPMLGLVSLGVTVQSKRNEVQRENATAERHVQNYVKKIRNSMREAGESFEEISNIIKAEAIKYDNKFLEVKFRSGVHLILDANEAKSYVHLKKEMDRALCHAMTFINGATGMVINNNPKSASLFMDLVGVLEAQINDLFSMEKTYQEVIDGTLSLIETLNQRLSEMSGNRF